MVVLSAAIATKAGKVLIARQFVEVSRTRIEGLLAAFPKLIGSGQQHTFIETENVRYVYQPLEELYVVLITTKTSNILEDLDTLHLFSRIVPEYCRTIEEEEVMNQRFELIFAFDEIIALGYRENVVVSQVKTFTEMESHEERIQEMVARNKEQEAKEQAKLRIKQMEATRKENKKNGISPGYSGGMGSRMMGHGSGSGMGSSMPERSIPSDPIEERPAAPAYTKPSAAKGMQLGKKEGRDFFEAMKTEDGIEELVEQPQQPVPGTKHAPTQTQAVSNEGVQINIEEKIIVVANRDGGIQNLEIKGDLLLRVNDPSKAMITLTVTPPEDKNVQFKTHPNVDKKLWSNDFKIGLKDATRPFPTGQPVGVLKWRLQTKDESAVPLTINCWPSPSGDGTSDVNIEYELEKDVELRDVLISIPIPSGGKAPVVSSVDGDYRYNKSQGVLEWQIPLIEPNSRSGTLEFSCAGDDSNQFFPVRVSFISNSSLCGVAVSDVERVEGGASVTFASNVLVSTEDYSVI